MQTAVRRSSSWVRPRLWRRVSLWLRTGSSSRPSSARGEFEHGRVPPARRCWASASRLTRKRTRSCLQAEDRVGDALAALLADAEDGVLAPQPLEQERRCSEVRIPDR